MRIKKSKKEAYQEIIHKYKATGEKWPASAREIAAWGYRKGLCDVEQKSAIDLIAPQISQALRDEYITDEQGRKVRRNHAIRETRDIGDGMHEQYTFWVDIEDAKPEEMHTAFQQRRMQVLGDCRQLKTDVDSYNDNNKHDDSIQMQFNFTVDLAELEHPVEYAGIK